MRRRIGGSIGRVGAGVAALATLGLVAAEAVAAQACIGYPQRSDGAVDATFSFPEVGTGYDLSGMVASRDTDFFLQGGFGLVTPDDDQLENIKDVHGRAAYEVRALAPDVSICPTAGVGYSWVEDLNTWTIPFGVGAGATVPLGRRGDGGFTPFVVPQFLYVRHSLDDPENGEGDIEDDAESEVFVGITGGLTINVEEFRVSGGVSKIFEEDMDPVFSLSVGAVWR